MRGWQRAIDFKGRALTVHDTFTTSPGTEAVFQLNVPTKPTIEGNIATAGALRVTVLSPAGARLTAVDWTKVDKDYTRGWRLDVRGPGNQFIVKLEAN